MRKARMSPFGTKLTARSDRAKSAFGRIADNKCSGRAFPLLTQSGHRSLGHSSVLEHTFPNAELSGYHAAPWAWEACMKRRQFIAAHGGAWSQPWAINAQQTDRVRPVGRYLEAMVKLSGKAMSRPSSSLPPSIGGGTHPPAGGARPHSSGGQPDRSARRKDDFTIRRWKGAIPAI